MAAQPNLLSLVTECTIHDILLGTPSTDQERAHIFLAKLVFTIEGFQATLFENFWDMRYSV